LVVAGACHFCIGYILICISSGPMHSRFPDLSEACRAYYTSCGNVAGNILYLCCLIYVIQLSFKGKYLFNANTFLAQHFVMDIGKELVH
jgi:hypothetical protein